MRGIFRFLKRCVNLFLEPVAGYTRLILLTKGAFLCIAVLLAGSLILVYVINAEDNRYKKLQLVSGSDDASEVSDVAMINPKFQGIDKNNQPYSILAKKAVQISKDSVELFTLEADVMMSEGERWFSLSSYKALYNIATEMLDLSGSVNLFSSDGYEFRTDVVHVNLKENYAYGDDPVEGQGPLGHLYATGFSVRGDDSVITFKGRVKLVFYPRKGA